MLCAARRRDVRCDLFCFFARFVSRKVAQLKQLGAGKGYRLLEEVYSAQTKRRAMIIRLSTRHRFVASIPVRAFTLAVATASPLLNVWLRPARVAPT